MFCKFEKEIEELIVSAGSTGKKIHDYTDEQIQVALTVDIEAAIALWKKKDWQSYRATRSVLMSLLRSQRSAEFKRKHLQYAYFINTHLYPLFGCNWSERLMFTSDLPVNRSINKAAWDIATREEFFDAIA